MKIEKINIIWNGNTYGIKEYMKFKRENEKNNSNKVLLAMRRTPNLLFAICMCLEKGITYIPIDPTYPKERIQYIIKNSAPDDLISDLDFELTSSKQDFLPNNDVAYILYTSGSTGNPKGVEVMQEGLLNFIDGISEIIDFSEGKRIACLTTVSFDVFFLESIMALQKGLTVVLATDDEQRNPRLMAELIVNNNIDMIQMTPSRMQLLLNHDKNLNCLKNVKEIMIGGEPFSLNLLKTLQEKTSAKIYNMYGPTETTIWSTVSDLTHKDRIDIGKPIKNTHIYILNNDLDIIDNGQVGEICISGNGLAKGYYGQDDLTAERFKKLPQKPGILIYRTGDLGRYLPDGELEYLGRIDNQIKIRGHRVELEEIENVMNSFQDISQAIVRTVDLNETDRILEAIYVGTQTIDKGVLQEYVKKKLPDYMIPAKFTQIEFFTYMPNGKIDRKNIDTIVVSDTTTIDQKPLNILSELQQRAFITIKTNLDETVFPNITIDTDLSGVGIDSITFIKIVVSLEAEFDFEFDDEMLLFSAFPTLRVMVEYVESKVTELPSGEKDG